MRCHRLFILLFALTLSWSHPASAALLTLTPVAYDVTLAPGASWDARGTITNLSGKDLLSTEIFLEFSAYPHAVLAPRQRLGGIEFSIGNRTISDLTELFHVEILPDAVGGMRYSLDVFAVDVHGNFSEPATYTFLVDAPAVVPEPSTVSLLAAALLAAAGLARRRAPQNHVRGG